MAFSKLWTCFAILQQCLGGCWWRQEAVLGDALALPSHINWSCIRFHWNRVMLSKNAAYLVRASYLKPIPPSAYSKWDTSLGRLTWTLRYSELLSQLIGSFQFQLQWKIALFRSAISHSWNLGEFVKFCIFQFSPLVNSHLVVLVWILYVECLPWCCSHCQYSGNHSYLAFHAASFPGTVSSMPSVWRTLLWWYLFQGNTVEGNISFSYSLCEQVKPLREFS